MPNDTPCIDDRRGLLFTINRDSSPLYQVESRSWAHATNRWIADDIPPQIRDKVAHLLTTGKPGAFVRLLHGEVGVYVICEKNIKTLPEPADDEEIVVDPHWQPGSTRELSPYDIILCTKGGPIRGENGDAYETQEGDYYVVRCQSWGRFILNQVMMPSFVGTTKEMLLLLENLHDKNFLSMSPDKSIETLPPDMGEPVEAPMGINCYVLNLSRFKR